MIGLTYERLAQLERAIVRELCVVDTVEFNRMPYDPSRFKLRMECSGLKLSGGTSVEYKEFLLSDFPEEVIFKYAEKIEDDLLRYILENAEAEVFLH